MNNLAKSPVFRLPYLIPKDVIGFYYNVLANYNVKKRFCILFLLTVVTGSISIYTSNGLFFILLSAVALIIGIYTFFQDFFTSASYEITESYAVRQVAHELQPSPCEVEKHGYVSQRVPARDDTVIFSPTVNKYLRENGNKIRIVVSKEKENAIKDRLKTQGNFYRDVLVWKHRDSRKKGKMFFDEEKISLASNILSETVEIRCFKSSYFISFLTNEIATLDIEDQTNMEEPSIVWKGIDHFQLPHDGKQFKILQALDQSLLSNHIGGNTIGISKNNRMYLWRQSRTAQRSEGLLAPTGSGSLNWSDYEDSNKTLADMVIRGMERELCEESTKSGGRMKCMVTETKMLGYYRWCGKAGLPAFVAVSKLDVLSDHLVPNKAEVQNPQELVTDYPAGNLLELTQSVDRLLALPNLSVPLYVNLICLKEVINQDPQQLDFLFS